MHTHIDGSIEDDDIADFTGEIVDAHCHLNLPPLADNIPTVIEEARAAGLTRLLTCSVSLEGSDWERTRSIASSYSDFVIPFYGLHPCYLAKHISISSSSSSNSSSNWESELDKMLQADVNAHVGECGLDKRVTKEVSKEVQEHFLRRHFAAAQRHGRVLCIHCVQSWGSLYSVLKEEFAVVKGQGEAATRIQGVLLHSSNSLPEDMVSGFAALPSVYFSLNGRHTTSAKELATIRKIPSDKMLLETDSPDQLPLYFKSLSLTHNSPRLIRYTVLDIARILKVTPTTVASTTTSNFNILFRIAK